MNNDAFIVREALDLIVKGLADYTENHLKLDLTAITPASDATLQTRIKTYREGADQYSWRSLFNQFCDSSNKYSYPLGKVKLWVEIPSGKYKGSIGYIGAYGVKVNDKEANIVKGMKLLPNYEGAPKLVVATRVIKDIFNQTIEDGDKVIFAERGKLRIGVLAEYDFHTNMVIINTPEGKETINPRKSQIVNCQKINESFIANSVLTAMLKRD